MRPTFAFLAALAAGALAQGVTELLTPTAASPPSCTDTRPGSFQITVQNVTKSKRDLTERQVNGKLEITLTNGILKDSIGRTGCIVANHQFQFDGPPQAGVIYTGGWSVCPNGSLAIGASAIFYQCLSGSFFNLYDKSLGGQCNQIYIEAIGGGGGGGVVSSTPVPSTTSPTSTTKGPSSASATANSTTLVPTPKTSTSTHSSAANATASSTGAAGGAASASASASASVSASASASASASGTGAGASGSSASESSASSTTVVVTTSPSGSAASTPSGSSGGASSAPAATTSGPPASTGGAVPGAVLERQGLLALAAAVFGAFAML